MRVEYEQIQYPAGSWDAILQANLKDQRHRRESWLGHGLHIHPRDAHRCAKERIALGLVTVRAH